MRVSSWDRLWICSGRVCVAAKARISATSAALSKPREGKDDDDEPSSPSRPSEVKDAKEIGNRQRTLSRTLSERTRAATRTPSDDGDKARRKVEALVGVLANAQATSTKLLKAASQLRVLAMDKDAKAAVVDAGAVPHLAVPNSNIQLDFNAAIVAAGAVEALCDLCGSGGTTPCREGAAGALRNLSYENDDARSRMVACGAVDTLLGMEALHLRWRDATIDIIRATIDAHFREAIVAKSGDL
ncbi:hypothetical protein JL720_13638 [Aureococcus anophagefferens]|nr:hypothetical protein JL720_13638 [Aureococcus anophagefferens]